MAQISYKERVKNSKLTAFEELREAVVANVIKSKPLSEGKRGNDRATSLGDFGE